MKQDKWLSNIDSITIQLTKLCDNLSIIQLNWKEDSNSWSIAQIIEHLIITNNTFFDSIQVAKNGNNRFPMKIFANFFGKMVLKSVNPDKLKKRKTFTIWEPSKSQISMTIVDAFKKNQEQLKQSILDSSELINNRAVISSPLNKNIVYKLDMAFEIIINHQFRHYQQALDVFNKIQLNSY